MQCRGLLEPKKHDWGRGGSPAQRMHRRRCTRTTRAIIIVINIVQRRCGDDFGRRPPPPPPRTCRALYIGRSSVRRSYVVCVYYRLRTPVVARVPSGRRQPSSACFRRLSRVRAEVFASRLAVTAAAAAAAAANVPRAHEDRTRSVFDMDAERFRFPKSCKCTIWYDTSATRFRRILHVFRYLCISFFVSPRARKNCA